VNSDAPRDDSEQRVRRAFEELRALDREIAPPFASLWGRPAAARRRLPWWALWVAAAAAGVVLVWLIKLGVPRPGSSYPELVGVHEPEPLAFLLERPGGDTP
jgi:type VI protein secretion system component VasF